MKWIAGSIWPQQQKQSSSVLDGSEVSWLDSPEAMIEIAALEASLEILAGDSATARLFHPLAALLGRNGIGIDVRERVSEHEDCKPAMLMSSSH